MARERTLTWRFFAALVVPVLQSNPAVNPVPVAAWLWVLVAGTVTMLSGGVFYMLARRAQRTFVLAQGLLAELLALPPAPRVTGPTPPTAQPTGPAP